MQMSSLDRAAKNKLIKLLKTNGYKTYSKLLEKFDVNMTDDPSVIAYMKPGEALIVINKGVNIDQASVLIRHEILHEYLKHEKRLLTHLAKQQGIDPDTLTDDISLRDLNKKLKRILYKDDTFNYAADYEISNRGYTKKDKENVRNIELNGRILSGLVTEDDHPDWVDLSVEEMYDKLKEEREQMKQQRLDTPINGLFIDDSTFIDPITGAVYGVGEFDPTFGKGGW